MSLNEEFYNTFVDDFDKIPFHQILPSLFVKYASTSKNKVLEIGSGPGAFASWMSTLGYDITCIEPAERPAKKAREKGLKVLETTLQNFHTEEKYDCVVALSSLIHIPKIELPAQIKKIADVLTPEGLFLVSFIEGVGEVNEDPTNVGKMRFFSKFSEAELQQLLSPYFVFIEKHKIKSKRMNEFFVLIVLKLI